MYKISSDDHVVVGWGEGMGCRKKAKECEEDAQQIDRGVEVKRKKMASWGVGLWQMMAIANQV